MRQIWKAKIMSTSVHILLPKIDFDKDESNFSITMCANPQEIIEFPAYSEESARRIAEFILAEIKRDYDKEHTISLTYVPLPNLAVTTEDVKSRTYKFPESGSDYFDKNLPTEKTLEQMSQEFMETLDQTKNLFVEFQEKMKGLWDKK